MHRQINGFPILLFEADASAAGNVVELDAVAIESIANALRRRKGKVFRRMSQL